MCRNYPYKPFHSTFVYVYHIFQFVLYALLPFTSTDFLSLSDLEAFAMLRKLKIDSWRNPIDMILTIIFQLGLFGWKKLNFVPFWGENRFRSIINAA